MEYVTKCVGDDETPTEAEAIESAEAGFAGILLGEHVGKSEGDMINTPSVRGESNEGCAPEEKSWDEGQWWDGFVSSVVLGTTDCPVEAGEEVTHFVVEVGDMV